jgi:hypothetical protein
MRAFEIKKEIIEVENELYEVLRKIREEHGPIIDTWKEHLSADKVFRKDGWLFFCRHIQEAKIEEWTPTENTDSGSSN